MTTFKEKHDRQRDLPAKNMRFLINTLRNRMMDPEAVAYLLDVAIGTSRKYLAQLSDAGCVLIDHFTEKQPRAKQGRPVYRLSGDEAAVQKFLALVDAHEVPPPASRRPLPDPAVTGRHFHILGDDQPTPKKMNVRPAFRDELVAAFFGPAGAAA